MKLEPIEDRIVVDPEPASSESSGGLIIPDSEREKPQKGTVIAVGSGASLPHDHKLNVIIKLLLWIGESILKIPHSRNMVDVKEQDVPKMILKEGDKVLFGKLAGSEINIDGKPQLIMRQSDVLCRIIE
jgi:chaperonin GroES